MFGLLLINRDIKKDPKHGIQKQMSSKRCLNIKQDHMSWSTVQASFYFVFNGRKNLVKLLDRWEALYYTEVYLLICSTLKA